MFRALVPFVVGVIIADVVALPLWGVAIGFVVCSVMAAARYRHNVADAYIVVALLLAGMLSMELRQTSTTFPDTRTTMEILVENVTSTRPRSTMADARLVAYTSAGETVKSRTEVRLVAQPKLAIEAGDRLLVDAKIMPFDESDYYGRYMLSQGVAGQIFLTEERLLSHHPSDGTLSQRLRKWGVEHLQRLSLNSDCEAVVLAMSIGERSGISPTIRSGYTRGGAAHLLAVSGLHVGFVCVVANLLLAWMILFRHGQVLRTLLVIILIWLFAAMAGFTPSIVRAAVMFTILQAAIQLASRTDTFNTLCLTAFVMLVWDARVLYDAGFQLSFLAVAAIIEWGTPLFSRRRRGAVAWCWHSLATGVVTSAVATVATLPLTAYLFGAVSLWAIVTGSIMVALSGVVVAGAMVWILLPVGALQGVAAWAIGGCADMMNSIATWCAERGVLALDFRIGEGACWAVYSLLAVVSVIVWASRGKN